MGRPRSGEGQQPARGPKRGVGPLLAALALAVALGAGPCSAAASAATSTSSGDSARR
ncbi:MAG: hypothetical protein JWN10_2116, partial [Solirubrobacterales bacterium]|nr:hypothetical protein [Solirubrobacterales bacterium]